MTDNDYWNFYNTEKKCGCKDVCSDYQAGACEQIYDGNDDDDDNDDDGDLWFLSWQEMEFGAR